MDELVEIFNEVQVKENSFEKNLAKLTEMKNIKKKQKQFIKNFLAVIDHILVHSKKGAYMDRTLEFIKSFVESTKDNCEEIVAPLLVHILEKINCSDKTIRYHCCELITIILNNIGEEPELPDEVWDGLTDNLITRADDTIVSVREKVCYALSRLQIPDDENDITRKKLIEIMEKDDSPSVRLAALSSLVINDLTIEKILARCRDIDSSVRNTAYKILKSKWEINSLHISERIGIVLLGLKDENENVRDSVISLIVDNWLSDCEYNILSLLDKLDIDNDSSTAEVLLPALFKASESSDNNNFKQCVKITIDYSKLDILQTVYWRCRCMYLKQSNKIAELEEIIPEMLTFIDLCNNNSDNGAVITELYKMIQYLDLHDEVGKRSVIQLLKNNLEHVDNGDDVYQIMEGMKYLFNSDLEFVREIVPLISDILHPIIQSENGDPEEIMKEIEILRMQVQSKEVLDRISELTNKLATLTEIPVEISIPSLLQALYILCSLLENTTISVQIPELSGFLDNFVLKNIANDNSHIREKAVNVLSLYCLKDQSLARRQIVLFCNILINEDENKYVKEIALKILFDLSLVYTDILTDTELVKNSNFTTEETLIAFLVQFVNCDNSILRTISIEGIGKLILFNRYISPQIMGILILLYYNPSVLDEVDTHLILDTIFQLLKEKNTQEYYDIIENAFTYCLHSITEAPSDSPIYQISLYEIGQFFLCILNENVSDLNVKKEKLSQSQQESQLKLTDVELTPNSQDDNGSTNYHERIAIEICCTILAGPNKQQIKDLCKLLVLLNIHKEHKVIVNQINILCKKIKEECGKITGVLKLINQVEDSIKDVEEIETNTDKFDEYIDKQRQVLLNTD